MKVAVFSTKPYDRNSLDGANSEHRHELVYFDARLSAATAPLARGCEAVCAFVNDELNAKVLDELHCGGVRLVALRCAGYNNVDLDVAERHRLVVALRRG
jgi:D-lactate dehydrogenase